MNDPTNLLVVEDNDLDVERIQRLMKRNGMVNPLHHAVDGEEALALLRPTNADEAPLGPCVILLDLNMPRMNGFEFLRELRNDPTLAATPVFVLSTSDRPADIAEAGLLDVVDYIVKPISAERLQQVADWHHVPEPTTSA